ncbi:hypothetical protein [Burkholderia pseudomallei]|uniref:hypothetical protein n=1 Tax=Burkholderia pseudomallei TaxID=28450 RepID=UPI0021F7F2FB|nr:hypothetical protein [Burkholderia pseudomallei]MCW0022752.1 hypothetical protein [Burkholderia pseudomallei]
MELAAVAAAAVLLAGCKGDLLDYRNTRVIDGKVYTGESGNPIDPHLLICDDRNVGTAQRSSGIR